MNQLKFFIIFWIVWVIISFPTWIMTKRLLKINGYKVAILNNEFRETKDLYHLYKNSSDRKIKSDSKFLFIMNLIRMALFAFGFIYFIIIEII